MTNVATISPRFQVIIPREIRERLGLEPGQKVKALVFANRIELIPLRQASEVRGLVRGLDTKVRRERDRL